MLELVVILGRCFCKDRKVDISNEGKRDKCENEDIGEFSIRVFRVYLIREGKRIE